MGDKRRTLAAALGQAPSQFWYLCPRRGVTTAEFKLKWEGVSTAGRFQKSSGVWVEEVQRPWEYDRPWSSILGNSFLQNICSGCAKPETGTVDAIFCDEELPEHLYSNWQLALTLRMATFTWYLLQPLGKTSGAAAWTRRNRARRSFRRRLKVDCVSLRGDVLRGRNAIALD